MGIIPDPIYLDNDSQNCQYSSTQVMAMSHYRVSPEDSPKDNHRLTKAQSSSAAFGEVFATKNKPASKKFLPFCLVTVHDFGPESYEINGQNAMCMPDNRSSQEFRFSDPESLLAEFSFLQRANQSGHS